MYKERFDNKLYFGPLWDFDLSFGGDGRVYPLANLTNFVFKYSLSAGTMSQFVTQIFNNEKMLKTLKEAWKKVSESDIRDTLFDFIDEQYELIEESSKLNYIRWDVLKRKRVGGVPSKCTYKGEIQYVKDFIIERFDQLDEMIKNATPDFINKEVRNGRGWGGGAQRPGGQGGQRPGGQGGQRPDGQGGQKPDGQWGQGGQGWPQRNRTNTRPGFNPFGGLGIGELDENCIDLDSK